MMVSRCLPNCLLLCLLAFFQGSIPLPAQEGGGEREVRGRQAWIIATAFPDDLENPAKFMTGKDVVELILSKRSVGNPLKVPEDGVIRMVKEIPDPEDPAKIAYQTLAKAVVPQGVGRALVILVPVRPNEQGLLYSAKIQDLKDFRGGDTMYMNLSPKNVMVRLGGDNIGLRSGETKIHDSGGLGEAVNRPVSYHHFDEENERWKLLSASTIVLRPTRREICIFSWDPRFGRISYHGVTFPVSQ